MTSHGSDQPSSWVARWAHLLAPGAGVLDLACGSGRHARWLAARGHVVTAADRDRAALDTLARESGITTIEVDLERGDAASWPFVQGRFGAIVVTNYLHRPLFPLIVDALASGGVLIYETFMLGNERYGRPSNPNFLLAPDELWNAFAPLRRVAFEQGLIDAVRRAMVQRIVAVRATDAIGFDAARIE